jgi:PIN domain nuclease of toxin-antitoxin system
MEPYADGLMGILTKQGSRAIDITPEISDFAGALVWEHRDPFDRIIAATSIVSKLPLMSADKIFDELSSRKDWPGRIW